MELAVFSFWHSDPRGEEAEVLVQNRLPEPVEVAVAADAVAPETFAVVDPEDDPEDGKMPGVSSLMSPRPLSVLVAGL
jgi:hypothetical protein